MSLPRRQFLAPEAIGFLVLLVYPFAQLVPVVNRVLPAVGGELTDIFIFAILALGLNVVVGYAGMLHLGIAAFFGIGSYITGILTYEQNPFGFTFVPALLASTLGAAVAGLLLAAPTLRLRGDYLALVTLGFGEVVRYSLQNLDEITAGTKSLSPLPPPHWSDPLQWRTDYRLFYYLILAILALVYLGLRSLERSRLGRAWVAIREDELAATCMGINAGRVKLSAFALGSALAGLAGCLYATKLSSTAQPDSFDFNRSVIILCCVILGGLGSLRGTLLGVLLLVGFDSILAPRVDSFIQSTISSDSPYLAFSSWRLAIFGLALILMMRFRPEGLLPSLQVQHEFHHDPRAPAGAAS